MDERWLTVDDICKYLNVSNETVYKWIDQRAMPGHRVGRRWMFKQDEDLQQAHPHQRKSRERSVTTWTA